eukprot:gene14526-30918_t
MAHTSSHGQSSSSSSSSSGITDGTPTPTVMERQRRRPSLSSSRPDPTPFVVPDSIPQDNHSHIGSQSQMTTSLRSDSNNASMSSTTSNTPPVSKEQITPDKKRNDTKNDSSRQQQQQQQQLMRTRPGLELTDIDVEGDGDVISTVVASSPSSLSFSPSQTYRARSVSAETGLKAGYPLGGARGLIPMPQSQLPLSLSNSSGTGSQHEKQQQRGDVHNVSPSTSTTTSVTSSTTKGHPPSPMTTTTTTTTTMSDVQVVNRGRTTTRGNSNGVSDPIWSVWTKGAVTAVQRWYFSGNLLDGINSTVTTSGTGTGKRKVWDDGDPDSVPHLSDFDQAKDAAEGDHYVTIHIEDTDHSNVEQTVNSHTVHSSATPFFNRKWQFTAPHYRSHIRLTLVDAQTDRK